MDNRYRIVENTGKYRIQEEFMLEPEYKIFGKVIQKASIVWLFIEEPNMFNKPLEFDSLVEAKKMLNVLEINDNRERTEWKPIKD